MRLNRTHSVYLVRFQQVNGLLTKSDRPLAVFPSYHDEYSGEQEPAYSSAGCGWRLIASVQVSR